MYQNIKRIVKLLVNKALYLRTNLTPKIFCCKFPPTMRHHHNNMPKTFDIGSNQYIAIQNAMLCKRPHLQGGQGLAF